MRHNCLSVNITCRQPFGHTRPRAARTRLTARLSQNHDMRRDRHRPVQFMKRLLQRRRDLRHTHFDHAQQAAQHERTHVFQDGCGGLSRTANFFARKPRSRMRAARASSLAFTAAYTGSAFSSSSSSCFSSTCWICPTSAAPPRTPAAAIELEARNAHTCASPADEAPPARAQALFFTPLNLYAS